MRVFILCFLVIGALSTESAGAKFESDCKNYPKNTKLNLSEVVSKSQYIAIYRINHANESDSSISHGKYHAYEYALEKVRNISGNAPYYLKVLGLIPIQELPPYYFELILRHQDIVDKDDASLGLSGYMHVDKYDRCMSIPYGKVGYYLLVLGNLDSNLSYEPITSPAYDPLVSKLQELAQIHHNPDHIRRP